MIRFGTGGWRDIIGENFTFSNVRLFAQGIANKLKEEEKIKKGMVIGFDNRFMSEDFAKAAAEIFAGNQIPVILLNKSVPTPLVTYVTKVKFTAGGITITASHNPYNYLGIKYVGENGTPATVGVTQELEQRINALTSEDVQRMYYKEAERAGLIVREDYHHDFVEFIEEKLDMTALRSSNLKVLYDPMYGTGVTSILTLLVDARCHLQMIHDRKDPLFGGRLPAPSEDTLWRIMSMMKEEDFDVGLATDGDADRIALIDNEGNYMHANEILSILYYYFLEYKGLEGNVVRNLSTTHLLDRIAETYGQKCIETPVGFKYIAQGLLDSDAILGGESSGGITIRDHLLEKDGILSAGLLLEMLAVTNKSLVTIRQEMREQFGEYHFQEKNVYYQAGEKDHIYQVLFNQQPTEISNIPVIKINDLDGIKFELLDGSWISCRFSGTEPVLRFMAESDQKEKTSTLIENMENLISTSLV